MKQSAARRSILVPAVIGFVCLLGSRALGATGHDGGGVDIANILLALIVVLVAAKLGGDLFVRLGQPPVLGELIFGIIVGNLHILGFHGFDFIAHVENGRTVVNPNIEVLSKIGVILLLFQVGLESDLKKMMRVGGSAFMVATLGVVAPFLLGWGVAAVFLPKASVYVHVFIGATLCATSVGITARVFMDLGKVQTSEARIVLGAAVIDDVQGLIVLAVVTGVIGAACNGGALSSCSILFIVIKAVVFLVGGIFLGHWIAPMLYRMASRLKAADLLLTTSLGICFGFAYLAKLMGLDPIVGAFAAGLILDEVHWRSFTERGEHSVDELVRPIAGFLVPIFFVVMGARVDLTAFGQVRVLEFAAVLTAAAIIGKQICGLGVLQKGLDRISVGIGMIPRGEVGLIFADIGSRLMMGGVAVIAQDTFSAVVIMVVITTMITPPLLKWSLARSARISRSRTLANVKDEP